MKILTPEDYSRKFGIEPELSDKPLPGLGSADLRPAQGEPGLRMSGRESASFYERGIVPDASDMEAAYRHRYDLQSTWDRSANAIARGTIGALGVMLEDASYMTLQPLGEITGALDEWEQNAVAQWGDSLKKLAHERFPNYQADPSQVDWSPWAILGDLIENGLGFAVPGAGLAKGVALGTKAMKASKLGAYASHLRKVAGAIGSTEKALNFIAPGLISNYAEGTMMGFETYKSLKEQGYSEEEASAAANEVRNTNRALMLTDMIQLHGIYKGTKALRNTMNNPSEWKQNIKSAFTTMNADNPFFQSLVEGGEEVFQGIIQREAENKVTTGGKELRSQKDLIGRIGEYFKDESLWYEGALGFLSGGAQQMAMKEIGNAMDRSSYNKIATEMNAVTQEIDSTTDPQRKVMLEKRLEDLKNDAARTTQQGMYEAQQEMIKNTEEHLKHRFKQTVSLDILMKEALASGELDKARILQSVQFRSIAFDNMARGTLDTLERQLEDMLQENLSKEEIADRGWEDNYKQQIQKDLNLLKVLESDYIQAQGYVNPSEVYHQKQKVRVVQESLNEVMSSINDIINGTKDENNEVATHGLKATAERIASELNASEFNFNKFMSGGLKLGDVEDEVERNKLKRAKEKVENSEEYKKFKEADRLRKRFLDEIDIANSQLEKIKSLEYQEAAKDAYREIAKAREEQKKADAQKKKIVEEQQKADTQTPEQQREEVGKDVNTPPTVGTATPMGPETPRPAPEAPQPAPEEVTPPQPDKVEELVPEEVLEGTKVEGDLSPSEADVRKSRELQAQYEKEQREKQKVVESTDSYKVATHQREFVWNPDGEREDISDDYRRGENGEYLEDIINILDPQVREGTELIFQIDPTAIIYYKREKIPYEQYERENGLNTDLIPIRILTKDGKFLGWVPSGSKKKIQESQLRSSLYSKFLDGVPITAEITYKYDGQLFMLMDGAVMNGEEAFPNVDTLAVVGNLGKVTFSDGKEVPIDDRFKNPGFTHIILPDGRFVVGHPDRIGESHANIMVDAIEIFVRSIHNDNRGKPIQEVLPEELIASYNALKAAGYDVTNKPMLESFLAMYLFTITPDKAYNNISQAERALGINSPLSKFVALSPLAAKDKPMVQIQSNGVAFLMNNQKTPHGTIGYSIGANSPLQTIDDAEWKDQLRQVILNSYRNTDIGHLNKQVVDLQKDNEGKITSKKTTYNKLAKSGISVRAKQTNLGTEDNPQWVHTVNPVVRFKLTDSKPVEEVPTIVEQEPPVSEQGTIDTSVEGGVSSTPILDQVRNGSLDASKALKMLEEAGLQNAPEYREVYTIAVNEETGGEIDEIILAQLPIGDIKIVQKIQNELLGILKAKGYVNSSKKILDYAGFLNEVNKFSDKLNQIVINALPLPASFNLGRIMYEQNGMYMFNMNALGFYDLSQVGLTQTNGNMMGQAFSDAIERYELYGDVEEFIKLSKIHKVNCK